MKEGLRTAARKARGNHALRNRDNQLNKRFYMKTFVKICAVSGAVLSLTALGVSNANAGGWPIAAGVAAGVTAGAIVGTAVAASTAPPPVYYAPGPYAYAAPAAPVAVAPPAPVVVAAAPAYYPYYAYPRVYPYPYYYPGYRVGWGWGHPGRGYRGYRGSWHR